MAVEGAQATRRHLPSTTIPGTPRLNIYHPDMQGALVEVAAGAGAEVHRGVRVRGLKLEDPPKVIAQVNGRATEFATRLVVGADGRISSTKLGRLRSLQRPGPDICRRYSIRKHGCP